MNDFINSLTQRKAFLEKEQERLLNELKEKYTEAHEWLKQNGIDLSNIGAYYKKVALAVIISTSVASAPMQVNRDLHTSQKETIETLAVEDIRQLQDEDQLKVVWFRYGPVIDEMAQKYDVDKNLIIATIMLESRGDTFAYRYEPHINDASYGLGQILYGTAKGIGFEGTPDELYDPAKNIELIAKYHSRNKDVYGKNLSAEQLTIAYNSGSPFNAPHPGHVQKFNNWYSKAKVVTTTSATPLDQSLNLWSKI